MKFRCTTEPEHYLTASSAGGGIELEIEGGQSRKWEMSYVTLSKDDAYRLAMEIELLINELEK